jgi:hypothetical protein
MTATATPVSAATEQED